MISDESGSWCPEINGKLNISSFHDKKIEEKPCSAHLKNSHISAECSMQVPKLWFWAHISSSLIIIIINGTCNIATTTLMLLKIQIFFWSCNYLRNFSLIYPTFSSFCFFRHKITVLIFFLFWNAFTKAKIIWMGKENRQCFRHLLFWKYIFALKEYCIARHLNKFFSQEFEANL